ncbi:MAG TPA: TonB family protein [Burkholderiaceae bacterium]
MNASNIRFENAPRQDSGRVSKPVRERVGSFAVVLAMHAALAAAVGAAMHRITRPVQAEVPVRLIDVSGPLPLTVPNPMPPPPAKVAVQISLPRIEIPAAPAMDAPSPVVVAAPAPMQAPQTEAKPIAPAEPAGAGDAAPLVDASAAGNAKPVYPRASKALGEQGVVVLDVFVTQDGVVGDIRVGRSSGYGRLDESALRAVRQWHFIPARQGGKQVSMWYKQPITFDLRRA